MTDELVQKLNRAQSDIRFCAATDAVVCGHDLVASGNRSLGAQIAVVTHGHYETPPGQTVLGRRIGPGEERFPACRLVRRAVGHELRVVVVDAASEPLTRALYAVIDSDGCCDEGSLAWYGPVEDICTPWSDNDPPQCQVVTLERLRVFAKTRS